MWLLKKNKLLVGASICLGVGGYLSIPPKLDKFNDVSSLVVDCMGEWLHVALTKDEKIRLPVTLEEMNPQFIEFLIQVEDKRFYTHLGVDFKALTRALFQLIKHQRVISGGSTITMQLVRLLNPRPRNILSKCIEILEAFRLECHLTKKEILQAYLTLVPMGGNIEGIKAGTYRYFKSQTNNISWEESAFLIALPQSPTKLKPSTNHPKLLKKRNELLLNAHEVGLISKDFYESALKSQLPYKRYAFPKSAYQIVRQYPNDKVINTTLLKPLQEEVSHFLEKSLKGIDNHINGAILIANSKTGEIVSYIGSAFPTSHEKLGFVDMIQAVRSPGSTLKTFVYGLAFDEGWLSPSTFIKDEPIDQDGYTPSNFTNTFAGDVTIKEALQRSLNIPAVKIFQKIGPYTFLQRLNQAKIKYYIPKKHKDKPGLPIILGGIGIRLYDLVQLYTCLANDGNVTSLSFQKKEKPFSCQFMKAISSNKLRHILKETATLNDNPFGIAIKTGTSYGHRDAFCVGVMGDYVIGVWVGRVDGIPIPSLTGRKNAVPLFLGCSEILLKHIKMSEFQEDKLGVEVSRKLEREKSDFEFEFPKEGATLFISSKTTLYAKLKKKSHQSIFWYLNGKFLKETKDYKLAIPAEEGFHTLCVLSDDGKEKIVHFRVIKGDE